jgi:hypothetical protein
MRRERFLADGRATTSRKGSRRSMPPTPWQRALAPCYAVAKPCSASRRYPASRICGLTAQGLLRGSDLDINVIAAEVGYLEARDAKNSFANVWDEASATFALAPR